MMINQLISRSLGISCILVFALLGAPRSSAMIIANWDHPTKDLAPTVVDPNVTATSQSLVPQDQVNLSSTTAIYTNINGNAGEIWFCGWDRSEEHTSELQSRGLISYAVFCLQ